MTRHDVLVQPAAPHRWPTAGFAPGATATIVMHDNLINTVVADVQMQPGRRPPGKHSTPYAAVRGRHLITPKRKTP